MAKATQVVSTNKRWQQLHCLSGADNDDNNSGWEIITTTFCLPAAFVFDGITSTIFPQHQCPLLNVMLHTDLVKSRVPLLMMATEMGSECAYWLQYMYMRLITNNKNWYSHYCVKQWVSWNWLPLCSTYAVDLKDKPRQANHSLCKLMWCVGCDFWDGKWSWWRVSELVFHFWNYTYASRAK